MIMYSAVKIFPINSEYPIIFTGKRHSDCFEKAFSLHIEHNRKKDAQGFLTDEDKFLDRYEAKHEARKCHQLLNDDGTRELFSEDIWPE